MNEVNPLVPVEKAVESLTSIVDGILAAYKRGKELDVEQARIQSQARVMCESIAAHVRGKEIDASMAFSNLKYNLSLVEKKIALIGNELSVREEDERMLRDQLVQLSGAIVDPRISLEFRSQLIDHSKVILGLISQRSAERLCVVERTNGEVDKYIAVLQLPVNNALPSQPAKMIGGAV